MWFPVGKPVMSREGKEVTTPMQAYGGTHSYARRYAMLSGLGLATCDEDDDGAMGAKVEKLRDSQIETIRKLLIAIGATDAERTVLANCYGVEQIADIPRSMFEPACERLNKRLQRLKDK